MGKYKFSREKIQEELYDIFKRRGKQGLKPNVLIHQLGREDIHNASRNIRYFKKGYPEAVNSMTKRYGLGFTYKSVKKLPKRRSVWSDEKAFAWLNDRYESGKPMDCTSVSNVKGSPYFTLVHETRYKNYENIFRELKKRYPEIDLTWKQIIERSKQRVTDSKKIWSKEKILKRLYEHHKEGVELKDPHYLSHINLLEKDQELALIINHGNYFNNTEDAINALNKKYELDLNYDKIRLDRVWFPEDMENTVRSHLDGVRHPWEYEILLHSKMSEKEPLLVNAAQKKFGTWSSFINGIGFNYKKIHGNYIKRLQNSRKEKVIDDIFSHFSNGQDLNRLNMLNVDSKLVHKAEKPLNFRSWYIAVRDSLTRHFNIITDKRKEEDMIRWLSKCYAVRGDIHSLNSLLLALYKTGIDPEAKTSFVKENLGLVWTIAYKVHDKYHPSLPVEDLVGYGVEGLIHGIEKFQFKKGAKASTYLSYWIQKKMTSANISYARTIRLPEGVFQDLNFLNHEKQEFYEKYKYNPNFEELAEFVNWPMKKVKRYYQAPSEPFSMNEKIGNDDERESIERIEDKRIKRPDEIFEDNSKIDNVELLLKTLGNGEELVLRERFGLMPNEYDQPKTQEEIGQIRGVTGTRIGQIEKKALKKLRRKKSFKKMF